MPRNTDILSLGNLGPGSVPSSAVEDSALKNPQRDTLPLSAHINDPSRAHMADSIGITDSGGFYSSDEVEGALQEIGGGVSGSRQNGVLTGFGFTSLGLDVTFDTPSQALAPTLRDFSGEAVSLPDNTPSVWVYVSSGGVLSVQVSANPPSISSPENILLWRFATLGGSITEAQDARLYVKDVDRKLPLTVRSSGSQENQESEACFVTLAAAMTYLQYGSVLGSLRTEVVIRGAVDTSGPINLPSDGIHFRGEDSARINLVSGSLLFDLNGKSDVTFSDIAFTSDVVASTAFQDLAGGSVGFTLERCSLETGGQAWHSGVKFDAVDGYATLREVSIQSTDIGVSILNPVGVRVDSCKISSVGFSAGAVGVKLGFPPQVAAELPSSVISCTIQGFDNSVSVSGTGHIIQGCSVYTAGASCITVGRSKGVLISGCLLDCSVNSGKCGIIAEGNPLSQVLGLQVLDNTILGSSQYGVRLSGFVQQSFVQGNDIDCYLASTPNDPTANAGIFIGYIVGSPGSYPAHNRLIGNNVWRAKTGIYMSGNPVQPIFETVVSGNSIHHCAVGVVGAPGAFQTSVGIYAQRSIGLILEGNTIYGIGTILTPGGSTIQPTLGDVYAHGITLVDCDQSTVTNNRLGEFQTLGSGKAVGIQVSTQGAADCSVTGTILSANSITSIPGIGILCNIGDSAATHDSDLTGALISGNNLTDVAKGVSVRSLGKSVVYGLALQGNVITRVSTFHGIELLAKNTGGAVPHGVIDSVQISGNSLSKANLTGILVSCEAGASASNVRVTDNFVLSPGEHGVSIEAMDPGILSAGTFSGFVVRGNTIQMDPGVTGFSGIYVAGVTNGFSSCAIGDNAIQDPWDGIKFEFYGPGPSDVLTSDISVSENKISLYRNFGVSWSTQGVLTGASVLDNVLSGQVGSSGGMYFASACAVATNDASKDLIVARNDISAASGSGCITLNFVNMKLQNLKVDGNSLKNGSSGLGVAVANANFGPSPGVSGLFVRGNTLYNNEVFGVFVGTSSVDEQWDFDFSGNVFDRVSKDLASPTSSVIRVQSGGLLRNCSIRNNQFLACGHNSSDEGGVSLLLQDTFGLSVSGNQFEGSDSTLPFGVGNAVYIAEDSAGPWTLQDISISGNVSRNYFLQWGVFPAIISVDLAQFSEVRNLHVCGNTLDRNRKAGFVDNSGISIIGPSTSMYGLRVEGNSISGASVAFPITASAILVECQDLTDGSVTGNSVAGNSTTGVQGTGVVVSTPQGSSVLSISQNRVLGGSGASGMGFYFFVGVSYLATQIRIEQNYASGYDTNFWVSVGACRNFIFSRNESRGHISTGILFASPGVGGSVAGLSLEGNLVATNETAQSYGIYVATTDSNSFDALSVCSNTVRYAGGTVALGYGLFLKSGSASTQPIGNSQVHNNRIQTFTDGLVLESGGVENFSVDSNSILDAAETGLSHAITGAATGYSMSENQIQARKSSTALGLLRISFGTDSTLFSNARICGNNVFGGYTSAGVATHGGDYGIFVGDLTKAPNMKAVSVSGNTVRLSGAGVGVVGSSVVALTIEQNTVHSVFGNGITFNSGGVSVGDFHDVSFVGNSVRSWGEDSSGIFLGIGFTVGASGANYTRGLLLNGNNLSSAQTNSYGYFLDVGTNVSQGVLVSNNACLYNGSPASTWPLYLDFGVGAKKNYSFMGNVFRGSSGGITQNGVHAVDQSCILGNIGDAAGSWSQFENGGAAGWTSVSPPAGAGAGQFQTLNIDDGT